MRPNIISKGASAYVVGKVERFDQKNYMFKRAWWDASQQKYGGMYFLERWDGIELLKRTKVGFTWKDAAFEEAAWRLESEFGRANTVGNYGLYAWDFNESLWMKPPEGVKLTVDDPAKMTADIKKVATFFGASLVGICKIDKRWVYSHSYNTFAKESTPLEVPEECKYAIAIAIEMDYEFLKMSPVQTSAAGVAFGYSQMALTAGLLTRFIHNLGYKAIPSGNDMACSIPIAIDAGLGELGRNGLLITQKFGPRIRLCKIFTDLPLVPDKPIEFGVWDFCRKCKKCSKECPSRSIPDGEPSEKVHNISNREGLSRWAVNGETCFKFWATNHASCSNCIRSCPFNKQIGLLHDSIRWGIKHLPWANKLFLQFDDLLGYGKQAVSHHFWETK